MTPRQAAPTQDQLEAQRAQKRERAIAERENVRSIQGGLAKQTNLFSRIRSPRISIANGRRSAGFPLV